MPGAYVFPGGRRDRADSHAAVAAPLHPAVREKLQIGLPPSASPRRAQALGVAALRETFEETGLRIAPPEDAGSGHGCHLDLSRLRYIARAITPPGRPRRYDARFFACFADEARFAHGDLADTEELGDLRWVALSEAAHMPLPSITRLVLAHLVSELRDDPRLPFGRPVAFYRTRGGNIHCMLV
ncbi:MAG: NUDIX hydrolase [Pararhizobium sp.]